MQSNKLLQPTRVDGLDSFKDRDRRSRLSGKSLG
jgi:hypothetical protein